LPDLSTLWQNVANHGPSNAPVSDVTDPGGQGHWSATNPQHPDSHSQADLHAGGDIVNDASEHANSHATLPDLITQTGHDWFFHGEAIYLTRKGAPGATVKADTMLQNFKANENDGAAATTIANAPPPLSGEQAARVVPRAITAAEAWGIAERDGCVLVGKGGDRRGNQSANGALIRATRIYGRPYCGGRIFDERGGSSVVGAKPSDLLGDPCPDGIPPLAHLTPDNPCKHDRNRPCTLCGEPVGDLSIAGPEICGTCAAARTEPPAPESSQPEGLDQSGAGPRTGRHWRSAAGIPHSAAEAPLPLRCHDEENERYVAALDQAVDGLSQATTLPTQPAVLRELFAWQVASAKPSAEDDASAPAHRRRNNIILLTIVFAVGIIIGVGASSAMLTPGLSQSVRSLAATALLTLPAMRTAPPVPPSITAGEDGAPALSTQDLKTTGDLEQSEATSPSRSVQMPTVSDRAAASTTEEPAEPDRAKINATRSLPGGSAVPPEEARRLPVLAPPSSAQEAQGVSNAVRLKQSFERFLAERQQVPIANGLAGTSAPSSAGKEGTRRVEIWQALETTNLHEIASGGSTVIGEVAKGSTFRLIDRSADGKWLKIETRDGSTGYYWAARAREMR
jgi:hypothetical protein